MYEVNRATDLGSPSPREVMARFEEEILKARNLDALDEIASEDFVEHDPAFGQEPGREGLKQTLAELFAAFPDQTWDNEDEIAEGEKVVQFFGFRCTHEGEFMRMAPTGRRVDVRGVVIDRVVDGRWTESRLLMDDLGMMRQLGVIQLPQ